MDPFLMRLLIVVLVLVLVEMVFKKLVIRQDAKDILFWVLLVVGLVFLFTGGTVLKLN